MTATAEHTSMKPLLPAILFTLFGLAAISHASPPEPGVSQKRVLQEKRDDLKRSYRLYLPAAYDPDQSYPVVIAIHGAFSTAAYHERRTGFSRLADRENFVVIYPNGIGLFGRLQHWNAGNCCGKAMKDNIDDVGFVLATLDDAARVANIDRTRVYVTGFSNGGMLAHRIGAERSQEVAAIAPVAAAISRLENADTRDWSMPSPTRAVPVLLVHGTADTRVPFEGGLNAARHWAAEYRCENTERPQAQNNGRIEKYRWSSCQQAEAIELVAVEEWPHRWPGPYEPDRSIKAGLAGFDAAESIWEFFATHSLNPSAKLAENR